jgi:hypothetical protein
MDQNLVVFRMQEMLADALAALEHLAKNPVYRPEGCPLCTLAKNLLGERKCQRVQ